MILRTLQVKLCNMEKNAFNFQAAATMSWKSGMS